MKIATNFISPTATTGPHTETLIQTEMGTYFILDEDLVSGEIVSHRVSADEAQQFKMFSKSLARGNDGPVSEIGCEDENPLRGG